MERKKRKSFIYTQENGNGPTLTALIGAGWRSMPGNSELSFARAEQLFELCDGKKGTDTTQHQSRINKLRKIMWSA